MEDGRLCYLDFGMMSDITQQSRVGLIRAVVHLVNKRFDKLSYDFVQLGFLSKEVEAKNAFDKARANVGMSTTGNMKVGAPGDSGQRKVDQWMAGDDVSRGSMGLHEPEGGGHDGGSSEVQSPTVRGVDRVDRVLSKGP